MGLKMSNKKVKPNQVEPISNATSEKIDNSLPYSTSQRTFFTSEKISDNMINQANSSVQRNSLISVETSDMMEGSTNSTSQRMLTSEKAANKMMKRNKPPSHRILENIEEQMSTYSYNPLMHVSTASSETENQIDNYSINPFMHGSTNPPEKLENQTSNYSRELLRSSTSCCTSGVTEDATNTLKRKLKSKEDKSIQSATSVKVDDETSVKANESFQSSFRDASEKIDDPMLQVFYPPAVSSTFKKNSIISEDQPNLSTLQITSGKIDDQMTHYYHCSSSFQVTEDMPESNIEQMSAKKVALTKVTLPSLQALASDKIEDLTSHYYYCPLYLLSSQRTVKYSPLIFSTLLFFTATSLGVLLFFIC